MSISKRDPKLLVGDILDSAAKILVYTEGLTFEDFTKDEKTVDAVIRNFEIIGKRPIAFLMNSRSAIPKSIGTGSGAFATGLYTITLASIIPLFGLLKRLSCPT